MTTIQVRSQERNQWIEVTAEVRRIVHDSNVLDGICLVFCPHTTAAVSIQENADSDVVHDLTLWMERKIPQDQPGFRHAEGNSDSHLKASLIGPSVMIPIDGSKLILGKWQGIFFCEFDGPRTRTLHVQLIGK